MNVPVTQEFLGIHFQLHTHISVAQKNHFQIVSVIISGLIEIPRVWPSRTELNKERERELGRGVTLGHSWVTFAWPSTSHFVVVHPCLVQSVQWDFYLSDLELSFDARQYHKAQGL